MTGFLLFFARIPVLVLALVTGVGAIGSGALGAQAFSSWSEKVQAEWSSSQADAEARISQSATDRLTLQVAIENAKVLLATSDGKTLDTAVRDALSAEIPKAQTALNNADELANQALLQLDREEASTGNGALPWEWTASINVVKTLTLPESNAIAQIVSDLGSKMIAVKDAQAAWQVEQDRVAAEAARAAAARAAAARAAAERAAAQNQISTTPVGQAVSAAAPTVSGFSVEAYIAALAPNAFVNWMPSLCDVGYICGRAWLGGVQTTPIQIDLDARLRSSYSTDIGQAVLVHEAAHARQWWTYSTRLIEASLAQAPQFTPPPGLTQQEALTFSKKAVEYMADCATIVKYGRGTGYTNSCTASQLSSIAAIWR